MYLHSVASKELIKADYQTLKSYERLDMVEGTADLLLVQSIEGRAHNGAGMFKKRNYVNTSIDDVVLALNQDPDQIKKQRQVLIDEIIEFVESTIDGSSPEELANKAGEPFLRLPLFKNRRVNARDILRGLYLGGLRDNPDIRKEAEKIYDVRIGGGRCYMIDIQKMLEMDLDGQRLAHEAHQDKIEDYLKAGLILGTEGTLSSEEMRYFYIRHRLGPGQSDDAAIVLAGILYNVDVALGVFLSDAIDTLEKYAPICKDQDGALSYQIARGFQDLGLTQSDVYELTALCAIPEPQEYLVADSSLRYLLSVDQKSGQTALRSHLDFVQGKPVIPMLVSYKRVLTTQFYDYINRRLVNVKNFEKLKLPNLMVKELDVPVSQLVKEDFVVLDKDATLADVIKKFKETKCSTVVVQDKNNNVLGILSPRDLLHFLE